MKQFKHFVAAALVMLGSGYALAQTEDNPVELQNGANTVTCGYYYTYVKYTATEDAMVTMEGVQVSDGYVTCGTELVSACPNYGADTLATYFAVEAGKSYVARCYTGIDESIELTIKTTPMAYNNGKSCSDPIVATEGAETYVPMVKGSTGWYATPVPVYVEFTPSITGKVVVTIVETGMKGNNSALANMFYDTDCDGDFNTFTNNSQMKSGSFRCEAGKKYLIRMNGSQGAFVTYQSMEIVEGASCEDAYTAKVGENVIPAAAGTYWYSLTSPAGANTYLEITSTSTVSGALQNSCTTGGYGDYPTNLKELNYRGEVYANSTRILKVVKETATADAESFTLAFASPQPYDKKSTSEAIEADKEYTTPAFNGTYYYNITTPAEGAYFLNVQTLNAEGNVSVDIYDSNGEYSSSIAYGTNKARYAVAADKTYWIGLALPVGMKSVPFKVTYEEVEPGMTDTNPLVAEIGENELKTSESVYYKFTCPATKWVTITIPSGVNVPTVQDNNGSCTVVGAGDNTYKFEGTADTDYIICFTRVAEDGTFTIGQADYALGEVRANPILITESPIDLPDAAGTTWYQYNTTLNGFLILETDLTVNSRNSIAMYVNLDTSQTGYLSTDWQTNTYKPYKIEVNADNKVLIKVTKTDEAGKQFTIEEALPAPGATPSNPILFDLADSDQVEVPAGDYSNPVYFAVKANKTGVMKMTSTSYASITMYSDSQYEHYVNSSSSDSSTTPTTYGFTKIAVTEGQYVYFKNTSGAATFTCSIGEPAPGEVPSSAVVIENDGSKEAIDFTFTGGYYGKWYAITLGAGTLNIRYDGDQSFEWYLYSEDDTTNQILYDSRLTRKEGYSYVIPEAGKYLLKTMYISDGVSMDVVISGSAVKNAATGVSEVEAAPQGKVTVYGIDGRMVAKDVDAEALTLAKGLYIINGKKVLVK